MAGTPGFPYEYMLAGIRAGSRDWWGAYFWAEDVLDIEYDMENDHGARSYHS